MPHYFELIPNVKVRVSPFRRNNVEPFVVAKNIFRKIKIRDLIQDDILGFDQYSITNNQRPDQVANDLYGDPELDWVILLCNNIINVYNEWPMDEQELYKYVESRYKGVNSHSQIHHHETFEVKSDDGTILLSEGTIVNSTFRYTRSNGSLVNPIVYPVSNWEHERALNEEKTNIWTLRESYIEQFVDEFESLLEYAPNEEVGDGDNIKMTVNAVEEIFITKKGVYSTEYGITPSVTFAGQQELGLREITTTVNAAGASILSSTSGAGTSATVVNSSGVIAGTTDASSTTNSNTGSSSSSSSGSSGSSGGY